MAEKREKKGVFKTVTDRVIDQDTGEVLSEIQQIQSIEYDREPDFVKLYLSDIIRLKELPPSSEKLLLLIVKHMGYNNLFQAYRPLKMLMADELKLSVNTLNQQIHNLRKAGILIPLKEYGRGLYLVDPNLFARGKWKDIKSLRLVVEYKKDGTKKLTSNMTEQLKQLTLDFNNSQ